MLFIDFRNRFRGAAAHIKILQKLLISVGILIGLTLTSIYFVGKITETKTHELIAEYNQIL